MDFQNCSAVNRSTKKETIWKFLISKTKPGRAFNEGNETSATYIHVQHHITLVDIKKKYSTQSYTSLVTCLQNSSLVCLKP